MPLIKISEASPRMLDWLVTVLELPVEGYEATRNLLEVGKLIGKPYSTSWELTGPLLHREGIGLISIANDESVWKASYNSCKEVSILYNGQMRLTFSYCDQYGETPLVAVLRCYCYSKFGEFYAMKDEVYDVLNQ